MVDGRKAIKLQLESAFKNQNPHGGKLAEIYRHMVLGLKLGSNLSPDQKGEADAILLDEIEKFKRKHPRAVVTVDGSFALYHRVHVVVEKSTKKK